MSSIGIFASARATTAIGERMVRVKAVVNTTTATFDEGTALDSTYLLVACFTSETAGLPTVPSGWTLVDSLAVSASPRFAIYARQGNGSANSVTFSITAGSIHIMGFSGFVSTTPAAHGTFDSNANLTSQAVTVPDTAGVKGVAIVLLGLSTHPTTWTGWTGTQLVSVAAQNAAGAGTVAEGPFNPGSGALTSTASWTGTFKEPGYIWEVFPLS